LLLGLVADLLLGAWSSSRHRFAWNVRRGGRASRAQVATQVAIAWPLRPRTGRHGTIGARTRRKWWGTGLARPLLPRRDMPKHVGHLVVVLCLAACSAKSADGIDGSDGDADGKKAYKEMEAELVAKHRAALTTRLEKLRAVQAAARKRPAISPLQVPATPAAGDVLGFTEDEVLDRKLDPKERFKGCRFYFGHDQFSKLNGAVGVWPWSDRLPGPDDRRKVEALLTGLETAVHAVVCVEVANEKVVVEGKGTFRGGYYEAECRVFDIETASYLGGWNAAVRLTGGTANERFAASELQRQLSTKVQEEMTARLRPFGNAPGLRCE
jgi:hypothetical protein